VSNFPPDFFPAEILITGTDDPENVIFRHGNFFRKPETPKNFPPEKIMLRTERK